MSELQRPDELVATNGDHPPTIVEWEVSALVSIGDFQNIKVGHKVTDYVREGETYPEASTRIFNSVWGAVMEKAKQAKAGR